jgi:hypothetical protein
LVNARALDLVLEKARAWVQRLGAKLDLRLETVSALAWLVVALAEAAGAWGLAYERRLALVWVVGLACLWAMRLAMQ